LCHNPNTAKQWGYSLSALTQLYTIKCSGPWWNNDITKKLCNGSMEQIYNIHLSLYQCIHPARRPLRTAMPWPTDTSVSWTTGYRYNSSTNPEVILHGKEKTFAFSKLLSNQIKLLGLQEIKSDRVPPKYFHNFSLLISTNSLGYENKLLLLCVVKERYGLSGWEV